MAVLDQNIALYKYFEEITKIPHGSGNIDAISDYLVSKAKEFGYDYIQDEVKNVIVYKPGTIEGKPIMLQGHMDMVCEKRKDVTHDFFKDPLKLHIEDGNILYATGTTLGADDGCAVASMLAIMEDKSLKHPDLELVFTVNEETTLEGAMNIHPEHIKARRIINLDGEDEKGVFVSSAGGKAVVVSKKLDYMDTSLPGYRIIVNGLSGGHSGAEIHHEKGNAIKLVNRVLYELMVEDIDVCLGGFKAGSKNNAIPYECECTFVSSAPYKVLEDVVSHIDASFKEEFQTSDAGVNVILKKEEVKSIISEEMTRKIVELIYVLPNGLVHMSMDIEDLPVVSLNMGIVYMEESFVLDVLMRSPMISQLNELTDQYEILCRVFGFDMIEKEGFSGWNFDPKSKLRADYIKFMKDNYDVDVEMVATHGGLETGFFKEKWPDTDIISIGPAMWDIHSPNEHVDLVSFKNMYDRVVKFLEIA